MKNGMDKEKDYVKNLKPEKELISFYLMMTRHIHFHVIALHFDLFKNLKMTVTH